MAEIKAKEISQKQFIRAIKDSNEPTSSIRYGFILGAGASVDSKIPSGVSLAKKWYETIKEDLSAEALKKWQKELTSFDEKNLAEFYSQIFEKRFEANHEVGYQELQGLMEKALPSVGYSFLAQMLIRTNNKFVITTNFDTMTEDAIFEFKSAKPLVLGHELLSQYINPTAPSRPTIIKIHRDLLLKPYNTENELKKLDENWQEALEPVLTENSMIVLGYGGNDNSLMNYLSSIKNRKPIYWCHRGDRNKLSLKIKKLLTDEDFTIEINGFDEFMLSLNDEMDFPQFIDKKDENNSEIIKNAIKHVKVHIKQLEELEKTVKDEDEKEAIHKLLPDWWTLQTKINLETDVDKQDELYKSAINELENSPELTENYASFLWKIKKEYDEAEKYYKKALELDSEDAYFNGNYALFLHENKKEYDEAEKYYKKSLELDPESANRNGNYAIFLETIKKDYNEAEKYYKKSLELDPESANKNGNYASFLETIKKDYDEADKYYKKSLELDSEDANFNGNYAIFLETIKKDYDEAEKYYKKSLELDPESANKNGNYANFLQTIKKDYDEAEKYYKKSLELDPESANKNGNYAQFLLILNRKKEAIPFIEKAFNLQKDENELISELWFYRLAHFPEFFNEAQEQLDRLIKAGHLPTGWDFSQNIEIAKKDGFKEIELLEDYAKRLTEVKH